MKITPCVFTTGKIVFSRHFQQKLLPNLPWNFGRQNFQNTKKVSVFTWRDFQKITALSKTSSTFGPCENAPYVTLRLFFIYMYIHFLVVISPYQSPYYCAGVFPCRKTPPPACILILFHCLCWHSSLWGTFLSGRALNCSLWTSKGLCTEVIDWAINVSSAR